MLINVTHILLPLYNDTVHLLHIFMEDSRQTFRRCGSTFSDWGHKWKWGVGEIAFKRLRTKGFNRKEKILHVLLRT